MRSDRRRRRVLLIVASGVVAAVLALGLSASGALDGVETASVDQRFQIRGTHDVPDDIVVVGIGDETIQELGLRPPFRRSVHAEAIRNLTAAGAKVIAYDIQFSEPTTPFDESQAARDAAEADDLALLDAMAASKRVVLGDSEVENGEPSIFYTDEDLAAAQRPRGQRQLHGQPLPPARVPPRRDADVRGGRRRPRDRQRASRRRASAPRARGSTTTAHSPRCPASAPRRCSRSHASSRTGSTPTRCAERSSSSATRRTHSATSTRHHSAGCRCPDRRSTQTPSRRC